MQSVNRAEEAYKQGVWEVTILITFLFGITLVFFSWTIQAGLLVALLVLGYKYFRVPYETTTGYTLPNQISYREIRCLASETRDTYNNIRDRTFKYAARMGALSALCVWMCELLLWQCGLLVQLEHILH
jgi:cytochrome c biogenesis protein CcdA